MVHYKVRATCPARSKYSQSAANCLSSTILASPIVLWNWGRFLLAMALMLEIESKLGLEISLDAILKSRSIAEVCAAVGESGEIALAVVQPIKSRPSERTLYFVHSRFDFSPLCDALTGNVSTAFITINGTKLLQQLVTGGDALAAVDRISFEYARAILREIKPNLSTSPVIPSEEYSLWRLRASLRNSAQLQAQYFFLILFYMAQSIAFYMTCDTMDCWVVHSRRYCRENDSRLGRGGRA